MKTLPAVPTQLQGRGHPDSVPVECDCGTLLLWERRKGAIVRCPDCKKTQTLDISNWKRT